MNVHYLDLTDCLEVAAAVTGLDTRTLTMATKLDLVDSALHAPAASVAGDEFFPNFIDKAAVLLVRLTRNHPLLDYDNRASWVTLRIFVASNDWSWAPSPSIDEMEQSVLAVAAREWDEERTAFRLRSCLSQPPP